MAIPKSSANKDGAWAYIKSRFSMDTQSHICYAMPVIEEALLRQASQDLNDIQANSLMHLIETTNIAKTNSDSKLREIIITSTTPYLEGDRSLEETLDILQSRASIYMAEKYSR